MNATDKKLWDSLSAKQGEFMKALESHDVVWPIPNLTVDALLNRNMPLRHKRIPAFTLSSDLQIKYIETMGYKWMKADERRIKGERIYSITRSEARFMSDGLVDVENRFDHFPSLLEACVFISEQEK